MNVSATTAGGRKGSIPKDGISCLKFSQAKDFEAKILLPLYQETRDGNLPFWVALMYAARNDLLTEAEEAKLNKIFDRSKKAFISFTGEPS